MSDSPYIVEVTEQNYQQAVVEQSHRVPVLVDFWASWCQPCQMLMPVLARLAEEYGGRFILAKVNTEEQQNLAASFGIRSIPTVKLFKNGRPVDEFAGALPESEIRAFLDRHIPRESDAQVEQARALLGRGQAEEALALLEAARQSDPDNPNIDIARAQTLAVLGRFDEAETILDKLPLDQQDDPQVKALRAMLLFDRLAAEAPPPDELAKRLEADPDDHEARYLLAAHKVMARDHQSALDLLLELMRKNRKFRDDAARKAMVAIFDLLGDDPLVARYRSKMTNLLF